MKKSKHKSNTEQLSTPARNITAKSAGRIRQNERSTATKLRSKSKLGRAHSNHSINNTGSRLQSLYKMRIENNELTAISSFAILAASPIPTANDAGSVPLLNPRS